MYFFYISILIHLSDLKDFTISIATEIISVNLNKLYIGASKPEVVKNT